VCSLETDISNAGIHRKGQEFCGTTRMMPNKLGIRTYSAKNGRGLSLPVSNNQESRTVLSSITSYVVALGIQALIPTVAIPTFSWMWMPCGGFLIVPMVFETVTKFLQSSF
jgi:hypothetical protein